MVRPTSEEQGCDEVRHQGAFPIVHKITVPQPFFRLALDPVLFAFLPPLRNQRRAKMISEVLNNMSRLSKHEGLRTLFSLYADKRGFA